MSIITPGTKRIVVGRNLSTVIRPTVVSGGSDLYNSLVAFWTMNETSGNRADSIGSNTLTDNNTVTNNTGLVYSNAAQFTKANNEYLNSSDNADLSTGDIDYWILAWVYGDTVANLSSIVTKEGTGSSNTEFILRLDASSQPEYYIGGSSYKGVNSSVALSTSTWYMVAVWHDSSGNTVNIKVDNNTSQSVSTAAVTPPDLSINFDIGVSNSSGSPQRYWDGRIGPVMLGKGYVPTEADLSWLYNSGSGRTLAEMASYSPV